MPSASLALAAGLFLVLPHTSRHTSVDPEPAVCASKGVAAPLLATIRKMTDRHGASPSPSDAERDPPFVASEDVKAVSDSMLCRLAGQAFRKVAFQTMSQPSDSVPLVLRVVAIPGFYYVENAREHPGVDDHWEVFIFTSEWASKGSFGYGG